MLDFHDNYLFGYLNRFLTPRIFIGVFFSEISGVTLSWNQPDVLQKFHHNVGSIVFWDSPKCPIWKSSMSSSGVFFRSCNENPSYFFSYFTKNSFWDIFWGLLRSFSLNFYYLLSGVLSEVPSEDCGILSGTLGLCTEDYKAKKQVLLRFVQEFLPAAFFSGFSCWDSSRSPLCDPCRIFFIELVHNTLF